MAVEVGGKRIRSAVTSRDFHGESDGGVCGRIMDVYRSDGGCGWVREGRGGVGFMLPSV